MVLVNRRKPSEKSKIFSEKITDMRKVLLLSFSLMTFYACDLCTPKLILINNTEDFIYYQLETDTVPYVLERYDLNAQFYLLYPHDTAKPFFRRGGEGAWVYNINKYATDSALHIIIFPTDKITEEIIKNREYVRLSYKVKELDSMNWTVVYRGEKPNLKE